MGAGPTGTTEPDVAHRDDDNRVAALAALLVACLEILAKAGQADAACRAAARRVRCCASSTRCCIG
jgi:hypothetical protein